MNFQDFVTVYNEKPKKALSMLKKLRDVQRANIFTDCAANGLTEIMKILLPLSDPKANDSEALCLAAINGHLEIVKLLIPVSDPKANGSGALRAASLKGHPNIVKLLLPVSDPKACESGALKLASQKSHLKIMDLLWDVSDVEIVNQEFKRNKQMPPVFEQMYTIRKQNEKLKKVTNRTYVKNTKKIYKM